MDVSRRLPISAAGVHDPHVDPDGPDMCPTDQPINPPVNPVGDPLPGWTMRPAPTRAAMQGRFCRVEPIEPSRHAGELFAANQLDAGGRN